MDDFEVFGRDDGNLVILEVHHALGVPGSLQVAAFQREADRKQATLERAAYLRDRAAALENEREAASDRLGGAACLRCDRPPLPEASQGK